MKTRLLIIIGFALALGFIGTAFGQYIGDKIPPNTSFDPVTLKEIFPPSYVDFYYSNPKFETYSVIAEPYRHVIPYIIPNGTISKISIDCNNTELVLVVSTTVKHEWLTLVLPRQLVDSKMGPQEDEAFMVLVDSTEVRYSDIPADKLRIVNIPLSNDTSRIKIMGVNYPEHMGENACNGKQDPPLSYLLSPLKQFKLGVPPQQMKCKEDLHLVVKSINSHPACVKETHVIRLVQNGWVDIDDFSKPPQEDKFDDLIKQETLSSKFINQTKSVPLTLFPVTPQNVTLPNTAKTMTGTTMISINKINQIIIINSDSDGQKMYPAQITMISVTLHTKDIESLPAKPGFNTLVFNYSIQSKDKDAFYASLDFEMQFGKQIYPTLLNGDEFSTPLLPDQKRDSSFAMQIGKNVDEITITVKDKVTKKTLWAIPLDLTPFNIKYRESSGILTQENEN